MIPAIQVDATPVGESQASLLSPLPEDFVRYAPMKRLLRTSECRLAPNGWTFRWTRSRIYSDYLRLLGRDVRRLHRVRREVMNSNGTFDDRSIMLEQASIELLLFGMQFAGWLFLLRLDAATRIAEQSLSALESLPTLTPATQTI